MNETEKINFNECEYSIFTSVRNKKENNVVNIIWK